MILLPLLFFLSVFYIIIKNNGFDISACITLMFVIVSFCGVILGNYDYQFRYENYSKIEIGIIPTIIYCFSIGICIYPFYKFNSNKKRSLIKIRHPFFLDILVYFYFFVFVFLLLVFWKDILFILAYGDMGELRQMQYEGVLSNALATKGGIVRVIGGLFTIVGDGAYFLLPIFFYSLCLLNKGRLYLLIILLGSITPVLLGFINIDRSRTAFWILLFILSFFLFKPYIELKSQKRKLKQLFGLIGGVLIMYLAVVTISRFGDRDEGASGGLLVYLGQPFINFCKIWDNIDSDHFFVSRVLPLTTFFLYGSSGTEEVIDYVMTSGSRTGLHLNVFFTYVGLFLVDMGHIAAILVPLMMFVIINSVIMKYRRGLSISLHSIIVVFAFAAVLQCGIITYFYTTVPRALSFWFFIWYSYRYLK